MDKLKALFENANLPTDFATKASVLFEASINEAVEARVRAEVKRIQEAAEENLEKSKKEWVDEAEEDLDNFLDTAIKEWAVANSAALNGSIKTKLAENILTKMRGVLESEGVDMPDEKEGAIKEAQDEVDELKEELDDVKKELDESRSRLVTFTKRAIIAEATKGLSKVAASKIASLSENIGFKSTRQYAGAVATITEAFGGRKLKIKLKEAEDESVFPATKDNSNASGSDKNKAAVETNEAEDQSVFPATKDNSNAAGADKNKAAVETNESEDDNDFFEDDDLNESDEKKDDDDNKGGDEKKDDDGKGGEKEDKPFNESFDVVAATLASMAKRING